MACRNVILAVACAMLVTGCQAYHGLRRDLGVDPVDPPRMAASPNPAPAAAAAPPVVGDISQASWAAQRAASASASGQSNTQPVGYVAPKPEAKAGPEAKAEPAPKSEPKAAAAPLVVTPRAMPAQPAAPPAAAPPASAPALKPGPAKTAAAPPAMPAAKMKDTPSFDGLWRVHLASHRTEWAAINEWQELLKRDPKLYGQFDPKIEWVDVKDRGAFARLLLGGWPERREADAACAKIRGPQRYCAAVKD